MNNMKHTESGRSMVEMLGVLAIIGVLTIIGIAGFRYALNKHYANEILNEGNKRAVVVAGQIGFNQGTPSLSEFANNTFTGGSFDTAVVTNAQTEQFGLKVSNVPEAVCQQILTMIDDHTILRRLSSADNMIQSITDCAAAEGTYQMVYNDDLTPGDKIHVCQTVDDCKTACATCENNVCTNECEIAPTTCTSNSECTNAGVCAGCVKAEGATTGTCQYACEELEYLESTGQARINTKYYPSDKTVIQFKYTYTSFSGSTFIGYSNGDSDDFRFFRSGGGETFLDYGNGWFNVNRIYGNYITSLTDIYETEIGNLYVKDMTTGQIKLSGANVSFSRKSTPVYLFGSSGEHGRLYFVKIYDDGELVRDFIPVLDVNGAPAMLDRVEQKLYYGGQFSYGRKQQ